MRKTVLIICSLLLSISLAEELKIHLPREVTVKNNVIRLGDIAVTSGDDTFVRSSSDVVLGRISVPGQKLSFDRNDIAARLASNNIQKEQVTFTGADQVIIRTQQSTIQSDQILKTAQKYLKEKINSNIVHEIIPAMVPSDIVLEKSSEITMVPKLVKTSSANRAKVQVTIISDGQVKEIANVIFNLKFKKRRTVTTKTIQAGEQLTNENTKIQVTVSGYLPDKSEQDFIGKVARRRINPNTAVNENMVTDPANRVLVKRNDTVIVRVDSPVLLVSATGKALEDGRNGELIKVQMQISNSSRRIINAKVVAEGTLEPVL